MPDTDPSLQSDTPTAFDRGRNLPAVVPASRTEDSENVFTRWLRALLGWRTGSMRADLKVVLEEGAAAETGFSPEESQMLRNILGLRERRVADVMVPRADIVAVQKDITLGELMKVFENAGHSRLVVYDDTLDDPSGMVHIRDLIAFMTARASQTKRRRKKAAATGLDLAAVDLSMSLSAAKIVRKILFVPPSMPAIDLLAKMQATRIHLALVVDEYGGTDGIVSMEDIVEQIVGEIDDEHDEAVDPNALIAAQTDGQFVVDALTPISDFNERFGADFDDDEYDTIGGLVTAAIGHLPEAGEELALGRFVFRVAGADARRVHAFHVGVHAES